MSDTIEQTETDTVDPGTLAEQEQAVTDLAPAAEAKPEKAPRPRKEPAAPHACACSYYRYGDKEAIADLFGIECSQTTQRVFAQGHDARLVSTLVQAQFDGYQIFRQEAEGLVGPYENAAHAVSSISKPLEAKAEKAIQNAASAEAAKAERKNAREAKQAERRAEADKKRAIVAAAKEAKKAEKAAAKPTPKPKPVAATVVEGSQEGDAVVPATDGLMKIKVGRWEYDAVNNGDGTLSYRDQGGTEQTRKIEEVRVLSGN